MAPVSSGFMAAPYVFIDLPKTGNSPLLSHLAKHLVWNEGIVYLGPLGDRQRHREGRPDLSVWSPTRRKQIRFITGPNVSTSSHELTGADEGRYFTVLRDPAEQWVAEYNASRDRDDGLPTFWDWYGDRRVNQTTRRLKVFLSAKTADEIAETLKGFWFVATTEHLAEDAPFLLREIGVPDDYAARGDPEDGLDDADAALTSDIYPATGRTGPHLEMTDEIRERIYSDHIRDRQLYKLALEWRASKRTRYGWD